VCLSLCRILRGAPRAARMRSSSHSSLGMPNSSMLSVAREVRAAAAAVRLGAQTFGSQPITSSSYSSSQARFGCQSRCASRTQAAGCRSGRLRHARQVRDTLPAGAKDAASLVAESDSIADATIMVHALEGRVHQVVDVMHRLAKRRRSRLAHYALLSTACRDVIGLPAEVCPVLPALSH